MTVIAWDGTTLAGDKRATSAGLITTVTKIERLRGHLVGAAGSFDRAREAFAWFERGAKPEEFTPAMADKEDYTALLVIAPDGRCWKYERTPYPFAVEGRFHAIGSGRDFAIAGMALGLSALEAVEFTARFVCDCGNGVDALRL